ncbi:MAG: ribosome-associated translation inhibitor RaiA [Candidatus Zixiibacteriota bacterium]
MNLRVTARHFDLSDNLKSHVEGRAERLERFFDNIIDMHWILDVDKHRQSAEVTVQVYGTVLTSSSVTSDIYASVDETTDKMEAQIKKYKARLKARDQRGIAEAKGAQALGAEGGAEAGA